MIGHVEVVPQSEGMANPDTLLASYRHLIEVLSTP
jgi:hypothetical protein